MFSSEFCELFINTCFVEDQQMAGSETPDWPGWGCLFNKVATRTDWSSLIVSGTDLVMEIRWKPHCQGIGSKRKGRTKKLVKVW